MTTSTPATPADFPASYCTEADILAIHKAALAHSPRYLRWLSVRLSKNPAFYASAAIVELNWAASLLASEPIRED